MTNEYKTGDHVDVICTKCGGKVSGIVNFGNTPPDVVSITCHYVDYESETQVKCEGEGERVRLPE